MAATMSLPEDSTAWMASWRLGDFGGLPNSVMSAPAMKVRPSQASTPALISGAELSFSTPSMMALRTPTLMAFTGGLLTQMMPSSPRFSNLPCMNLLRVGVQSLANSRRFPSRSAAEISSAVDQLELTRGLGGDRRKVEDCLGHLVGTYD